jgi:hypothetical protein
MGRVTSKHIIYQSLTLNTSTKITVWRSNCTSANNMKRESAQKPANLGRCPIEDVNIVLIDENNLMMAQNCIAACEYCAENASITFEYLLDALTGCDPTITDYLMCRPAQCPSCFCNLSEKSQIVVR